MNSARLRPELLLATLALTLAPSSAFAQYGYWSWVGGDVNTSGTPYCSLPPPTINYCCFVLQCDCATGVCVQTASTGVCGNMGNWGCITPSPAYRCHPGDACVPDENPCGPGTCVFNDGSTTPSSQGASGSYCRANSGDAESIVCGEAGMGGGWGGPPSARRG
jgi:hypothetical protein